MHKLKSQPPQQEAGRFVLCQIPQPHQKAQGEQKNDQVEKRGHMHDQRSNSQPQNRSNEEPHDQAQVL
ncbi:hypothetical protein [Hymenobacter citatus]|uniref:hypothetical protein n=1 Tax=Hymenobacter citatus TaxID=2763506 RepID=UPI0016514D50|nr:hypothetical protein [Hymenobacter citatus]